MGLDILQGCRFPPAGLVFIFAALGSLGVIDSGNLGDLVIGQFPMDAVDEPAIAAGVNKQGLAAAGAEFLLFVGGLFAGDKPKTYRNLGGVKQLPRQRNHAIHQIGFDDGLADFAFPGGLGAHGAVGHDKTRNPGRRQVMDKMLNPCVVGIVGRRCAVFPAEVFFEPVATPIGHIKRGIGQNKVGLEVFVLVGVETVGPGLAGISTARSG